MESRTTKKLALQNLDPWLTPMQAVVWIALRDPLLVRRASLDERESKEAAALIPNNLGCTDPTRAGTSLFNLEHFLGLARKRPVNKVDMALRCLMGSLRRGEVNASAEPYRSETGTRSSRVLMSPMEWAGITLADAPGDDRKLVMWRSGEISQFLNGCVLHDRWQCVLIKADDLVAYYPRVPLDRAPAGPDKAPDGFLFLDEALTAIMAKLIMPEGPALKWLREKLHGGDIQSYKRRGSDLIKCLPGAWADADIDLMDFKAAGNSGLRLDGQTVHLHRVVLAEPDLDFCLIPKVQEPPVPEPANKAQACVPAELAAWMRQHMQDGLDKQGVLPKRDPSVKQCMEAFGCSWRTGLAAYGTLPADLRRSARETDRALSVQRAHARTAIKTA